MDYFHLVICSLLIAFLPKRASISPENNHLKKCESLCKESVPNLFPPQKFFENWLKNNMFVIFYYSITVLLWECQFCSYLPSLNFLIFLIHSLNFANSMNCFFHHSFNFFCCQLCVNRLHTAIIDNDSRNASLFSLL